MANSHENVLYEFCPRKAVLTIHMDRLLLCSLYNNNNILIINWNEEKPIKNKEWWMMNKKQKSTEMKNNKMRDE